MTAAVKAARVRVILRKTWRYWLCGFPEASAAAAGQAAYVNGPGELRSGGKQILVWLHTTVLRNQGSIPRPVMLVTKGL